MIKAFGQQQNSSRENERTAVVANPLYLYDQKIGYFFRAGVETKVFKEQTGIQTCVGRWGKRQTKGKKDEKQCDL